MVLLRATGRGPSRARRTRIIHSVKKQRFRSPCAGPKFVLVIPKGQRHCCPTYEGPPARVYGYAWCLIDHSYPSATYVRRLIPWRGTSSSRSTCSVFINSRIPGLYFSKKIFAAVITGTRPEVTKFITGIGSYGMNLLNYLVCYGS